MKFGVVFPQNEFTSDPIALRDYIQTAEGIGLDYVLAYDHVLGANPERPGGWKGPYTHRDMFHEPFVMYAYMAALTQKIEFVTGILILPQRPAVLVAKQAAELDVLSNGRLRLGIGTGWNKVEYDALGYDFHNRGKRSDEQIILMKELWTNPLVTFHGQYHTVEDAGLNPLPVQRPIPLWFGGYVDEVFRRMARLGDGWIPNSMSPEEAKPKIETIRRYLQEAGRNPADFGYDVRIHMKTQPQNTWQAYIEGWQALGATHVCITTMGIGLDTPEKHIQAMQDFKAFIDRRA